MADSEKLVRQLREHLRTAPVDDPRDKSTRQRFVRTTMTLVDNLIESVVGKPAAPESPLVQPEPAKPAEPAKVEDGRLVWTPPVVDGSSPPGVHQMTQEKSMAADHELGRSPY